MFGTMYNTETMQHDIQIHMTVVIACNCLSGGLCGMLLGGSMWVSLITGLEYGMER